MSETLRAFVAIELPDQTKSALAKLIEELRRADVRGVRPVRPDGIHLTLKFLGDIGEDLVQPVVNAISPIARAHRPFKLRLGSPGAFPRGNSPRVLWVGIEGDLTALLDLQRQIEGALASLGFARDSREFSPHLTVARFNNSASLRDRLRAGQALFSAHIDSLLGTNVDRVTLMQSTLLPSGAVYRPIASLQLGKGPQNEVVK